jgi:hypothetical protein
MGKFYSLTSFYTSAFRGFNNFFEVCIWDAQGVSVMVALVKHDIEFRLAQIKTAEKHAAISQGLTLDESRVILFGLVPNSVSFQGLRTIHGSFNNLQIG